MSFDTNVNIVTSMVHQQQQQSQDQQKPALSQQNTIVQTPRQPPHHTVSRKHVELPLEMKRKLIEEREHGVPFTLLGKKYHIATSTAANIWRKKDFFMASRMSGTRKRCSDRTKYKIVNQVTALFVKNMLGMNHRIDGEVIKRFARTAAIQCNFHDFHGSNGWLDSFKKRENVRWVRSRSSATITSNTTTSTQFATMPVNNIDTLEIIDDCQPIDQEQQQQNQPQQRNSRHCLSCACRDQPAPSVADSPTSIPTSSSSSNSIRGSESRMATTRETQSKSPRSLARRRERDAIIDEWFQGIPLLCQLLDQYHPQVDAVVGAPVQPPLDPPVLGPDDKCQPHPLDVQLDGQFDDRQIDGSRPLSQVTHQLNHRYHHHHHHRHHSSCRHRHCTAIGDTQSRCSSRTSTRIDAHNQTIDSSATMTGVMTEIKSMDSQLKLETDDIPTAPIGQSDSSSSSSINTPNPSEMDANISAINNEMWVDLTNSNQQESATESTSANHLSICNRNDVKCESISVDDVIPHHCHCLKDLVHSDGNSDHLSECHNDECFAYQEYCEHYGHDEQELDMDYNVYEYCSGSSGEIVDNNLITVRDPYYDPLQVDVPPLDEAASDCYIRNTMSTFADVANQQHKASGLPDNTGDGLFAQVDQIDAKGLLKLETANHGDVSAINNNELEVPNSDSNSRASSNISNNNNNAENNGNNNHNGNNESNSNNIGALKSHMMTGNTNKNDPVNSVKNTDDGASMTSSSYYNYTYSEYGAQHCDLATSSATADQSNDELDDRSSLMTAATGPHQHMIHSDDFERDVLSCEHSNHDLADFEHEVDIDVDLELDFEMDERYSLANCCQTGQRHVAINDQTCCQPVAWRQINQDNGNNGNDNRSNHHNQNNDNNNDNNRHDIQQSHDKLVIESQINEMTHFAEPSEHNSHHQLSSVKKKLIEAVAKLMDYASNRSPNILAALIDLKQQIESDSSGDVDGFLAPPPFIDMINCDAYAQ